MFKPTTKYIRAFGFSQPMRHTFSENIHPSKGC